MKPLTITLSLLLLSCQAPEPEANALPYEVSESIDLSDSIAIKFSNDDEAEILKSKYCKLKVRNDSMFIILFSGNGYDGRSVFLTIAPDTFKIRAMHFGCFGTDHFSPIQSKIRISKQKLKVGDTLLLQLNAAFMCKPEEEQVNPEPRKDTLFIHGAVRLIAEEAEN